MTHLQKAYDALVDKLEKQLRQSYADNDALSHKNTIREMKMTKFVYEHMGYEGLLAFATMIDQHEKDERNDQNYDHGFVEMVVNEYEKKPGTWVKRGTK